MPNRNHATNPLLKLIAAIGFSTFLLWLFILPAYAQDPDLITDTSEHTLTYTPNPDSPGSQWGGLYQDYTIPETNPPDRITLLVKGGDGGDATVSLSEWACGESTCYSSGGKGAELSATFEIGTGANQLEPGGTLRFIIGHTGQDNSASAVICGGAEFGGGGGGSAVVYKAPGNSWNLDNAVMLLVAGAGGGAYQGGTVGFNCADSFDGGDGRPSSTSGGDGDSWPNTIPGGTNGCGGGESRSNDDTTTPCEDDVWENLSIANPTGWFGSGVDHVTLPSAEPG